MQRYPVLYGRSRRLRLRKKRIALFGLVLLLLLITGIGVNTIRVFNVMTDGDSWAKSLYRGAEEASRENYLGILVTGEDDSRRLMSLYFVSHGDPPYSLILPGGSFREGSLSLEEHYAVSGTKGVVEAFMGLTGEPVHYYLMMEDSLFPFLAESQGLRSRGPRPYYPIEPETGAGQVVVEVKKWEEESLGFVRELTETTSFWRWPALIRESLHLFETNISWRQTTSLMEAAGDFSWPENRQVQLPPGAWAPLNQGSSTGYMVDSLELETFFEYMKTGRESLSREEILVEVLNGCGVPGLAGRTARFLESEGFTVLHIADADHFNYQRTQVISRRFNVAAAKEVAVLIRGAQLIREVAEEKEAMVTVILGSDFDLERIKNP